MTRYPSLILCLLPMVASTAMGEEAQINVPDATRAAVATVDRFAAALSTGDLERAGAELDPDVIILESGGAEHSAAEYLGGHARHDTEFLKDARQNLIRRNAKRSGDLVWIASESQIHVTKDATPTTIASTETMVLKSADGRWKIVHIHWSSRTGKPPAPE